MQRTAIDIGGAGIGILPPEFEAVAAILDQSAGAADHILIFHVDGLAESHGATIVDGHIVGDDQTGKVKNAGIHHHTADINPVLDLERTRTILDQGAGAAGAANLIGETGAHRQCAG
ncbi:hypothetical protein Brsp05_04487 [Brucella sp. NBRC 12953]